jgi:hypothetical protein
MNTLENVKSPLETTKADTMEHPGHKPLDVSVRDYLDGASGIRKTHLKCEWHHSPVWDPGLNKEEKVGLA